MNKNKILINSNIGEAQEKCNNIMYLIDMLKDYIEIEDFGSKQIVTVGIFSELLSKKCKILKNKLNEIEFDFFNYSSNT